jgi:hypothetical protein
MTPTDHSHSTIEDLTPFFKAFCNSTRAQVLEFLPGRARSDGEMSVPLGVGQPLV